MMINQNQFLGLVMIVFSVNCQTQKPIPQPDHRHAWHKKKNQGQQNRKNKKIQSQMSLPFAQKTGPQKKFHETGVVIGGDVMLDWGIREVMQKKSITYPGMHIRPLVKKYDFALANLETPVAQPCDITRNKLYTFRAEPAQLDLLRFLNIKGVFLANNHIGDCGHKGMLQTVQNLTDKNIAYGGVGPLSPVSERKHLHLKIGEDQLTVLVYGSKTLQKDRATSGKIGAYWPDRQQMREDINFWRERSEYLLVSMHWGTEYYDRPLPRQRKLAHFLIDHGVDAVLGHHSHWVQGIERYKSGVIVYSLGNFIFGSNNKFLRSGYVAGFIFRNKKIHRVEIYPLDTKNQGSSRFQPRFLAGKPAHKVLYHVRRLSRKLRTPLIIKQNIGVVYLNHKKEYYKVNHRFRWKMEKLARKNKQLELQ